MTIGRASASHFCVFALKHELLSCMDLKTAFICTRRPLKKYLWCIHATIHGSTGARSYKKAPILLTPSISCALCEQNNTLDEFPVTLWWLHRSSCPRPDLPLGVSSCRGGLIHRFTAVAGVRKQQMDSDTSISRYLWVEADVWDGGGRVVRLVPEGVGLIKVAPQLGETNRVDYCCWAM